MYQWPGAVHYIVHALASMPDGKNDIAVGQCAKEIVGSSIAGVLTTCVFLHTMNSMLMPITFSFTPITYSNISRTTRLVAQTTVTAGVRVTTVYGSSSKEAT